MKATQWQSFGLPPLALTKADVERLVPLAGDAADVAFETSEKSPSQITQARLTGTGVELECTGHHATLRVDNATETRAEALQAHLQAAPSSRISIVVPLGVGALLGGGLLALGVRNDIAMFAAMSCMLLGIFIVSRLRSVSEPQTTLHGADETEWQTRFTTKRLGFDELGEAMRSLGGDAVLSLSEVDNAPAIEISAPGIRLTLRGQDGVLTYENSAVRFEPLYDAIQTHKRRLWRLSHDDLAILIGMVFPVCAFLVAPADEQRQYAGAAVIPWLAYLLWVLRNQARRWCVIRDDS